MVVTMGMPGLLQAQNKPEPKSGQTTPPTAQGQAKPAQPPAKPQTETPQAKAQPEKVEKFAAAVANVNPGAGEHLKIDILHWSTDAERDKLIATFMEKGDAELENALAATPTHGYIWTSESLGYSIRYAQRLPSSDGGERLLLATDRRLGVWTRGNVWKAAQGETPDYPFTLVEIHLTKRGTGEGKMSLGGKIAVDQAAKALALENYSAAPVMLKDVKREDTGARASN
jgi:hypothetical protein